MPFTYLDHTADVGVRAWGGRLDEAYCEAAVALFSWMVRLDRVVPDVVQEVSASAATRESLLVEWLSILLAQKDVSGLVFSRFDVEVREAEGRYELRGRAAGERLDPERHAPKGEVKGITYLGLAVRQERDRWVAEYVMDV